MRRFVHDLDRGRRLLAGAGLLAALGVLAAFVARQPDRADGSVGVERTPGAGLERASRAGLERESQAGDEDVARITRLLGESYVKAVFVARDEAAVRRGFHADFRLFVLTDEGLLVVTLDQWLERLGLDGVPSARRYEHRVTVLDRQQDGALARVDLWEDGRHRYVDHFALYRFPDGWRIVSKTFQSPP